jgi:hypothetical protein
MPEQSNSTKPPQEVAVYIPFKTIQTAITNFKPQTLPAKLDRSAWTSFSNLLQGQTLNAFKFLGLVDKDGNVQPALKELVGESLESDKFKTLFAGVIKSKYEKIIELANENGTITQLQDAMRKYGVTGTTLERAIRFWVEAAKFTGTTFPESWKKATGGIVKRTKLPRPGVENKQEPPKVDEQPGEQPRTEGYNKIMQLPGGIGEVTLIVSVNPIELKGKTRSWFYELVDKLCECPVDEVK